MMKASLTVLDKIQPATHEVWEKICGRDLREKGFAVLSRDLDDALSYCIQEGFAVPFGDQYRLGFPLKECLEKLLSWEGEMEIRREAERQKQDNEERERMVAAQKWVTTASEAELRSVLMEIAEDDEHFWLVEPE